MSDSKIVIYENQPEERLKNSNILVIEDIIESSEQSRKAEVYSRIHSSMSDESEENSAFFQIFYPTLTNSNPGNESSLIDKIMLYTYLDQTISAEQTKTVVIDGVSAKHECVVRDLCNNKNIRLVSENPPSGDTILSLLRTSLICMLYIIEQFLFGIISPITRENTIYSESPLFFPNPNRMGSMSPVIDQYKKENVVVPWPKLILKLRTNDSFGEYRVSAINEYVSVLTAIFSFTTIVKVCFQHSSYADEITEVIQQEFDFKLTETSNYSVRFLLINHLSCLCCYHPAKKLFKSVQTDSVVVGSTGGYSMAIHTAASEYSDITIFHIPHSITRAFEPILPRTRQFIASRVGYDYIEDMGFDTENLICSGRPYLKEKYENRSGLGQNTDDNSINVLVGTQPYGDDLRQEFIDSIISGINNNDNNINLRIKIHPNEDPTWYRNRTNTEVYDSGLEDLLSWADITIVINSNIGIEAVIHDSAVLYVNTWGGRITDLPFVSSGDLYSIKNTNKLAQTLGSIKAQDIRKIKGEQYQYVTEQFKLDSDILSEITNQLDGMDRK